MSTQSGDTQSSTMTSSEQVSDDSSHLKCKKRTKTAESTTDDTTSQTESDDISTSYASASEDSSKKMSTRAKSSRKATKNVTSTSEELSEGSTDQANGDTGEASSPSSKATSQTESSNVSADVSGEESISNTTSNGISTDTKPSGSSAGHVESDASEWTLSEDMLLRSMKSGKENISWADIGSALKKNKGEVKARWKIIKGLPYKANSDDEDGDSKTQESSPEAPREEQKKNASNKQKMKAKAIPVTPAETTETTYTKSLSGEEASSEASSEAHYLHRTGEERRQDRYLQTHIWSELYPSSLQPVPDDHFSADDCAILAAADSKHKRSRWLEMQANFYNVTGRMVPLDIIRRKCEQATERDVDKAPLRDGAVQRWIDSLSQED